MTPGLIRLKLESAATFGRGDGVAGLTDVEIEHDRFGLPYLHGRTLKGLLAESAGNVVYALELQGKKGWRKTKEKLFGRPGQGIKEQGILHIGDACIPANLKALIEQELTSQESDLKPDDMLYSLTGIRTQTAINPGGGPDHASLRSMRVVLKGVVLEAPLVFDKDPPCPCLELLTAATMDFRRAGTAETGAAAGSWQSWMMKAQHGHYLISLQRR